MDGFASWIIFIDKRTRSPGDLLDFFNAISLLQQLLNSYFIPLNILPLIVSRECNSG